MKKLFNHNKREYEKDLEWEDADLIDPYTDEENLGGSGDLEDGEYDEGETLEDGEYYEDETLENGEYYEGETLEDGEYYEDEALENGEYYEDETLENGEYYEDEFAEDDENYQDESAEDDEYDEEDRYRRKKTAPLSAMSETNVFYKLWYTFLHMSTMDRVVTTTGVLVLVLAIITGAVFTSANLLNKQVASFQTVGNQLSNVTLIGEHGLTAVADAELAKIQAANAIEEENTDYDENEFTKEVEVSMNMTSIEKDLKIKFVNSKTNKLIANVPFEVSVVTPAGKTETWNDDDMDGIIYKSNITPGDYSVTLNALTDEKYEDYIIPTSAKKTTVKKEIAYQKVEVSDEIKDESEVNSKKEDTKENETVVESTLTDTVAWVESTKTVLDATYTAVAKTSVNDPLATVKRDSFLRTAEVTMPNLNLTIGDGGTSTGSVAVSVPEGFSGFESVKYESEKPSVASVDADGKVTAIAVGDTRITFSAIGTVSPGDASRTESFTGSCIVTVTAASVAVTEVTLNKTTLSLEKGKSETLTATVKPDTATDKNVNWSSLDETVASVDTSGKITALKAGTTTITATLVSNTSVKAECIVTVTEPAQSFTLTIDKNTISAGVGTPVVIKATLTSSVKDEIVIGTVTAISDKPTIADVTVGTMDKGVIPITINPKAAGTAVITITASNGLTAVCTVTVTDSVISLEKATLSVLSSGKKVINAEVASLGGEFKVETSDSKIATAIITPTKGAEKTTAVVEITGVAAGSATITVSHTENGVTVKKTCTVTVVAKENKLLDSQKRQLYVLQADGKYREATFTDYYDTTITTFYIKTEGIIKYTGWQTIEGKLYYFDAAGKKVTGEQVIQGAKYNFASDGSLVVGSGSFGIDVSKWNGTIDWKAVKNSGVNYVIIRCGYRGSSTGALIEDPKFVTNIKGATAAGIKVGVYFFSQAINRSEAVEEASMVLEQIKKYTISYPVFLDVEASGGRADGIDKATRTEVIKAFCETIQNSGYTAGVYANKSWLTNKIDTSQLGRYKIWLAQYASAPTYTGRYDMWQYKSTGRVTGISGDVDMNLSYLGY